MPLSLLGFDVPFYKIATGGRGVEETNNNTPAKNQKTFFTNFFFLKKQESGEANQAVRP